jgi:hypothetical protein
MIRHFLFLVTAALFTGCANLPASTRSGIDPHPVTDPGKASLALAVARARADLTTLVGRVLWAGVYAGESSRGCTRVRLNMVERPAHQWHYLVCGENVLEIRDVAPQPERDARIVTVLDSLGEAAWKTGRAQQMPYDDFELEAEPEGPPAFTGCRLITQRLIYQDMLVDVRQTRTCGPRGTI